MAKKSARSKGYRKTVEKKPYLSKRDIIILCALVAALIIGAILLFTYDDGALKVKDGKIIDPGENWVVVNGAGRGGHRYYKLAEAGDIDGYTRASEPGLADENLSTIRYTPSDEGGAVKSIAISGTAAKPDRVAEYYRSMLTSLEVSELAKAKAGDAEYTYFVYTAEPSDDAADNAAAEPAEAAEEASDASKYNQAIHAYFAAPHDFTIGVGVQVEADSPEGFLEEDALKAIVEQAWAAVTVESK